MKSEKELSDEEFLIYYKEKYPNAKILYGEIKITVANSVYNQLNKIYKNNIETIQKINGKKTS